MKRFLLVALFCLPIIPGAFAQEGNAVQVGAFADYLRLNSTGTNMFGLGGRVGATILPYVQLEGSLAYDFEQSYTEGFTSTTGVSSVSFSESRVRTLHGLFGPRLNLGHSRFHPFVEVKGGFLNFMFSSLPPGYSSVTTQISNLRSSNISAVLMPGGGLEANVGPIGLRLDVGDEIYFNNGAHNNLAVQFGPVFRF
jgi:Outer membrane protein beta-barrel domain